MCTAAIIACIFSQLQKLFNVQVPCFQVGADRALALATLIDGNSGVVDHFEKRHHALRFTVRALDVSAQGAHRCPVIAQTASKF